MKIDAIRIVPKGKRQSEKATQQEYEEFRSVCGSLIWIVRVCRPDAAYRVSVLQQHAKDLKYADLIECNKVVRWLQEDPDQGLVFRSGVVDWQGGLDTMVVGTITDASGRTLSGSP